MRKWFYSFFLNFVSVHNPKYEKNKVSNDDFFKGIYHGYKWWVVLKQKNLHDCKIIKIPPPVRTAQA